MASDDYSVRPDQNRVDKTELGIDAAIWAICSRLWVRALRGKWNQPRNEPSTTSSFNGIFIRFYGPPSGAVHDLKLN